MPTLAQLEAERAELCVLISELIDAQGMHRNATASNEIERSRLSDLLKERRLLDERIRQVSNGAGVFHLGQHDGVP